MSWAVGGGLRFCDLTLILQELESLGLRVARVLGFMVQREDLRGVLRAQCFGSSGKVSKTPEVSLGNSGDYRVWGKKCTSKSRTALWTVNKQINPKP